jgi:hypothetical protein
MTYILHTYDIHMAYGIWHIAKSNPFFLTHTAHHTTPHSAPPPPHTHTDPDYSGGFQVLAQELRIDSSTLQTSLRTHYDGGSEVGQQFMRDYANSRQEFYNNKEENRKTLKQGVVFFIACCLLDWAVSTI